jgi:lipopolysaccharide assembly protein B
MDIDFTWLLWGLPLAFALGWVASRLDLRQWRMESRQTPKAYFRGLNHLLNEQQDQAIDAFIEAVQGDPDTAELHFALGNLFRRRGDYDRAVRVHEHLLARADINQKDRDRAQHALAMDFLKAGLLDRAEVALSRLDGSTFEGEALLALLSIYERSRDWPNAQKVAQKLEAAQQGSFTPRLAHYLCEESDIARANGDTTKAQALLAEAVKRAPQLARPWLATASLRAQTGDAQGAYDALQKLASNAPQGLPLAASSMVELAKHLHKETETTVLLQAAHEHAPSLDITEALAKLAPDTATARARFMSHLEREPSLVIATRWLSGEALSDAHAQEQVIKALDHASNPLKRYRCAACGFEARQHFWQCPGCQSWDSYPARRVEEL